MKLSNKDIGIQVSPAAIDDLCRYGMYGKVEKIMGDEAKVRWADGRGVWMRQTLLEPVPAVSTQSEETP